MKFSFRLLVIVLITSCIANLSVAQNDYATDSIKPRGNQLTLDVVAPFKNYFALGYETAFNKHIALDFRVGYIGVGNKEKYKSLSGFFFKCSPVFYFVSKNSVYKLELYKHFRGTYISPVFIYNAFLYNYADEVKSETFLLNFGHQFLISNKLSLNIYCGAGYSFMQFDRGFYSADPSFYFSHFILHSDYPIALDAGISVGYIFRSSSVPPKSSD
ncbi:hypothetical protein LBMAG27_23530 [Bacteroidota bacterium]|nr:hypothetical protein LBMAG27_23530 [Bacteroidota bacterium]